MSVYDAVCWCMVAIALGLVFGGAVYLIANRGR